MFASDCHSTRALTNQSLKIPHLCFFQIRSPATSVRGAYSFPWSLPPSASAPASAPTAAKAASQKPKHKQK